MKALRVDHLVLTVANIEKTAAFYESVLGMEKVVFGDNRVALVFGEQKINLHQHHHEFEPKAQQVMPGSADICLIVDTPSGQVVEHLKRNRVEIIEGPVQRTGALGAIDSVYFRDPNGNLIEVSTYLQQTTIPMKEKETYPDANNYKLYASGQGFIILNYMIIHAQISGIIFIFADLQLQSQFSSSWIQNCFSLPSSPS